MIVIVSRPRPWGPGRREGSGFKSQCFILFSSIAAEDEVSQSIHLPYIKREKDEGKREEGGLGRGKREAREGYIYHTRTDLHIHPLRVEGEGEKTCKQSPAESNHTARTSGDSVFFF